MKIKRFRNFMENDDLESGYEDEQSASEDEPAKDKDKGKKKKKSKVEIVFNGVDDKEEK